MPVCYQCDHRGYFISEADDFGGFLPAGAVYAAPPSAPEGFIPRFIAGSWIEEESHKGLEGYLDGQPYTIRDHGPLPQGFSLTPPPPTPEEEAALRKNEILVRLAEIDTARSRPMADLLMGQNEDFARQKLEHLEDERAELAAELV